jgi:hypothetical protein
MTRSRVALAIGLLILVALLVLIAFGIHGARTPIIALAALVFLIGGGNLLYGKNSHGAMAQARIRPAQEARNRAIDEARRQATQAAQPPAAPSPTDDGDQ